MADSRTLLLIEDDDTTRDVLTLLFEADGWEVQVASSGEAAVHAMNQRTGTVSAALCDMHLPGLRRTELAARLREFAPGAVLLAMSASHFAEVPAGYDAVLRKPLGPAEIEAALADLSSGKTVVADAAEEQGLSVLHPGILLNLRQKMGKRAEELYRFALADADDRIQRMEQAFRQSDCAVYRSEAHALKGSAGMIGAEQLANLAAQAEISTVNSSGISADTELERLQLAWERLHLALEAAFPV